MQTNNRIFITLLLLAFALGATAVAAQAGSGIVNINTADAEQLSLLPRVGPSLAARIVDFREMNGRFKSTEELILVPGIGERTFEQLKAYVAIEGETTLQESVSPSRDSTS